MEKSKKQLIILCGTPGSGKSTWIEKHFMLYPGYTKVVSRDEIRFSIVKENEDYFSHEKEVYNKFIEEIKDGLEHCDTTIADATHFNRGSRAKLLHALGSSLKDVEINIIVIKPSLDIILAQNAQREKRKYVPEHIIKSYYKTFEMPEIEEGFDNIFITEGDDKYTIIQKIDNPFYDAVRFTIDLNTGENEKWEKYF